MKKLILSCMGVLLVSLLASCAPQQPTYHRMPTFHAPRTASGKQCVQRCLVQKKRCDKRCGANHEQCLMRQKKLAHQRFVSYVNERVQADKPVAHKEGDFIDYDECNASCQCVKSYKNCYKLCGGAVTERKVCVSNCS